MLAKFYMLATSSVASAERSFSVQRRMKSYLRNRMTQTRYNNVLLLHIHKARVDGLDVVEIVRHFASRTE